MLYKNMKVKLCSPDRDTVYFDIVAGVLRKDTLASYLFIICLDYLLRTSIDFRKENDLTLEKAKSRRSYLSNPSARAGYETRSIFKRSLTGFNSEFSFS